MASDSALSTSIDPVPRERAGATRRLSLGAALTCVICVGVDLRPGIVSVGPLLVSVRETFGLSHAAAALLITIPDILMGLLAIAAPWLARRLGRDRVILAALILLTAATAARAAAATSTTLFLSTAGVGAGIAIAGALVGGFIKASYPERAALMMGMYTGALSLGSTLAAGLTGPLASWQGNWRIAIGAWAAVGLVAIPAWAFVERRNGSGSASSPRRYRLPVRSGIAWRITLFFSAQNFLFYSLISWLAALYREHGISASNAGLILASFTGTFFISNLVAGVLSRKDDRSRLLAGYALIVLAGLVGLAAAPMAMPSLIVPTIAIGLGGCFTLGMTLPLDNTRDADEANVWGAFMTLVAYLIAATGPLLVGALRDATGDFASSLWLLSGVALAMLAITPFLKPLRVSEAA